MMQPLAAFPSAALARIRAVLTDLDDTLTTRGVLTASAYRALERLHASGVHTIAVTGRPAGWCDHIARMWPVDAVVGENGAFWFTYDRDARHMQRRFLVDAAVRAEHRRRLERIGRNVLARISGARIAADQRYRDTDLAIDFAEDGPPLPEASIDQIVRLLRGHGLTTKVSSIHVNAWFGTHDKLATSRLLFKEHFGRDLERDNRVVAFVGDSPNDEPMFAFFRHAIGVANVRHFADRMKYLPAYVTRADAGAGFVEFTRHLLRARLRHARDRGQRTRRDV